MNSTPYCFFIMPFRKDLNFFYLYTQQYLHDKHKIHVERGDHKILTQPLMEKISRQITTSDFVIADITGGNPNVFYELGIAHTLKKPVIFITQDKVEDVPVDIRPFEFIKYDLSDHGSFLASIDNAVSALFTERHRDLFNESLNILSIFNQELGTSYASVAEDEFLSRVLRGGGAESIRSISSEDQKRRTLLAKIVKDTSDVTVMEKITSWQSTG
ncbi:MAG: hypothetical protein SWQ30_02325 [Thermodesulfobacteriota bacterium]|nr:hypothetical protein [Thermodesulfobacteriota bacterium]